METGEAALNDFDSDVIIDLENFKDDSINNELSFRSDDDLINQLWNTIQTQKHRILTIEEEAEKQNIAREIKQRAAEGRF